MTGQVPEPGAPRRTGQPAAEPAPGGAGPEEAARRRIAALGRRVSDLERELAQQGDRLRDAQTRSRSRDRELAQVRKELTALRRRRSVRLATGIARRAQPVLRLAASGATALGNARSGLRRRLADRARERSLRASADDERRLVAAIRGRSRGEAPTTGPTVSILVRPGADRASLDACLAGLRATSYRDAEVVVELADGDAAAGFIPPDPYPFPIRVIHASGSPDGVPERVPSADAAPELVLLLSPDVEPIADDWLGLLVEAISRTGAAAVGPRLVRGRWRGGRPGPDVRDLTLESRGVAFDRAHGVPLPRRLGDGDDPTVAAGTDVTEIPGLTGACVLVRQSALDAIGAATIDPAAGADGVDLGLRLRAAGERLVLDERVVMLRHPRAGDRPAAAGPGTAGAPAAESAAAGPGAAEADHEAFRTAWGPRVFRDALLDALAGGSGWSDRPFHVGITVTRDDPAAGFGDWYTGHELGDALESLGWRVSYLERQGDRWYDPEPSLEAVIVLLETCDIRRLPRRLITLAWIRNWAERWLEQPWMDDFDLVLAASARIATLVRDRTAKVATVVPIATNPERFQPRPEDPTKSCDVLFVGSYWGQHRAVVDALPALAASGVSVSVYGRGWEAVPGFAEIHRGFLAYDDIPAAYASARIVVDDAASSTLPYGSVNSRVFDALATGALVVSNGSLGVAELFGPEFPTWSSADDLVRLVRDLLADPDGRAATVARHRTAVLDRHTYPLRARSIRDELARWATATRWGIRIGVPSWDQIDQWGDYPFGRAIQRQLERAGMPTRLHLLPEWSSSAAARDDVSLHLFGLKEAPIRAAQVNLLWHISHPELAGPTLYDRYDRVFVASDTFAARLAGEAAVAVEPLHQATDPERFHPDPSGPDHELLFVANSRNVRRRIVDDLRGSSRDLAVYGQGWTADLIDPRFVKGAGIPNADLPRYYSSAAIVLNDHWDDMRAEGFLSNRLYDALACGAFVISDDVAGIEAEFDGAVVTYRDPLELGELIERYLADPTARRALGERGRRVVLERHTFELRVRRLIAAADEVSRERAADARRPSAGTGAAATRYAGTRVASTPRPVAPPSISS